MKVLLVEDDRKIASFVKKGLQEQGFAADVSGNGDDGLHMATGRTRWARAPASPPPGPARAA